MADIIPSTALADRIMAAREARKPQGEDGRSTGIEWGNPTNWFAERPAPDFDMNLLPDCISERAELVSFAAGHDPVAYGLAMLSACSAAIDASVRICLHPDSDYYQRAILWLLIYGKSARAKSPAMQAAYEPIRKLNSEYLKAFREEMEIYEVELEDWKKNGKKLGSEPPKKPVRKGFVTNDATVEALRDVMDGGTRGMTAMYDEICQWLGGLDAYKNGSGSKDRGDWLEAYDGGSHTVDRAGNQSFHCERWAVGIMAATTPAALGRHAKNLPPDGLLQRFISYCVKPTTGMKKGRPEAVDVANQRYEKLIRELHMIEPCTVTLSDEAHELFIEWQNKMSHLADLLDDFSVDLSSAINKRAAQTGRVALILHCLKHTNLPGSVPCSAETMSEAINIIKGLFQHSVALFDDLGKSRGHELTIALAKGIVASELGAKGESIGQKELINACRLYKDSPPHARAAALNLLVDTDWIKSDGRYRNQMPIGMYVNPLVHELFAEQGEEHRQKRKETIEIIINSRKEEGDE